MNAEMGDKSIDKVFGKWEVPGRDENGNNLVDVCASRVFVLTKHLL